MFLWDRKADAFTIDHKKSCPKPDSLYYLVKIFTWMF